MKSSLPAGFHRSRRPVSYTHLDVYKRQYLATGAVISAVSSTPTVASRIEGARTVLMLWNFVFRPPSNRISASATDPTR